MNPRAHCPSCHHRITPLVLECPVCGLSLARQPLPRPLLFQASALRSGAAPKVEHQTISAPALGRVEPLTILEQVGPEAEASLAAYDLETTQAAPENEPDLADSFWPVVRMEALEFLLLALLNSLLLLIACLTVRGYPTQVYTLFWPYILPVHLAISWACLMVPLVLVGQSPMMGYQNLLVDAELPERRMSFSLLHLFSTLCFPASFLCMVLTRDHRTLAELLSGQEILQLPSYRLR